MAMKHSTWHIPTVKPWILLALFAGCEAGPRTTTTEGDKLYQQYCALCHGPTGKPTEAMIARMNVRDLTSKELRDRVTPTLVEQQVRKGSQNKLMPAFEGALTDEQIKAIAAYVSSPQFLQ